MLQDNLIYIVSIALVGAVALSISYFITHRETNMKNRSERLRWLQKQTSHMLDAITLLKAAGCKKEILEKLNQQAMVLIEEISLLAPDSDLMTQVNNQKETADRTVEGRTQLSSDRDLKRFQIYVNFTEKVLSEMLKKHQITAHTAKIFGQDLYWLNISVVADAHISQAHQLIREEDKLTALSHLKHAKAVLVRAMVPQSMKQPKLNEIQPLIEEIQPKKIRHEGSLEDSLDDFLK